MTLTSHISGDSVTAEHRTLVGLDVVAFGSTRPDLQLHLRGALYDILRSACARAGIPWDGCRSEDRGDGVLLLTPSDVSVETVLDGLVRQLRIALRRHNQAADPAARIRLRAAIHAGYVWIDAHGVAGRAVIHMFRLLDAPAVGRLIADERPESTVVISHQLFTEVVLTVPAVLDPGMYRPVPVVNKETRDTAWVSVDGLAARVTSADPDAGTGAVRCCPYRPGPTLVCPAVLGR